MTMSSDEFVGWLDKELEPLRREAFFELRFTVL